MVPLRFIDDLGVPIEKINVNGGAIAMGHPLGATGAMLLGTLLDELERRGLRYGLATLCVGGGMGIATIIESGFKNLPIFSYLCLVCNGKVGLQLGW